MTAGGVLIDLVASAQPVAGIALDVWHATVHAPTLARPEGVAAVRRYGSPASGSFLCIAELAQGAGPAHASDDPAPPVPLREHLRFPGRPLGMQGRAEAVEDAPIAYPVFFQVPPAHCDEFDRWYDQEHVPLLLKHGHWALCRRFALDAPSHWSRLALHYLDDLCALDSPERDAARSTPWRRRLQAQPWFRFDSRVCFRLPGGTPPGSPS